MLTPTTFFVSIMMVISCFKIYDVVAIMTQGGPGRSTKMLVSYIFELSSARRVSPPQPSTAWPARCPWCC